KLQEKMNESEENRTMVERSKMVSVIEEVEVIDRARANVVYNFSLEENDSGRSDDDKLVEPLSEVEVEERIVAMAKLRIEEVAIQDSLTLPEVHNLQDTLLGRLEQTMNELKKTNEKIDRGRMVNVIEELLTE